MSAASRIAARLVVGAVAILVMAPTRVLAWTDADVSQVVAHIDVNEDHLLVSLVLRVQIHGGWLEGLEVADLETDLVLAPEKPPWAVDSEDPTRKYRIRATVRDGGRVQLSFDRHDSPRRGTLFVGLLYRTSLGRHITHAGEDDRARVRYTLPGFRAGLDAVQIAIAGPAGTATEPHADDADARVTHQAFERGGASVHVFERAHLPRTLPWSVEVVLPDEASDAVVARPVIRPRKASDGVRAPRVESLVLALLVALLTLASRWSFAAGARARGARARPLVPAPFPLALAVIAALVACSIAFPISIEQLLVSLSIVASFSLERLPLVHRAPPRLGHARPATEDDLACAERARRRLDRGHALLLDATAPLGAALVASFIAAVALSTHDVLAPLEIAAACALVAIPFLTGTRSILPPTPLEKLARLAEIAVAQSADRELLAPVELIVHEDGHGRIDDARLRLLVDASCEGLVRFDLALCLRPTSGALEPLLGMVLVTRTGSRAAEIVDALLGDTEPDDGPRGLSARVVPAERATLANLVRAFTAAAGTGKDGDSAGETARAA